MCRSPNTDINMFNDNLDNVLDTTYTEGKICCIMGGYNINILNSATLKSTNGFINLMSSYAFVPLIIRPTGVTADTATLIDNIFTNHNANLSNSFRGVLVHVVDTSHHYTVFHINRECRLNECESFMYTCVYSQQKHINWVECMIHVTLNSLLICFMIV